MLSKKTRILDLDGSVSLQKNLITQYHPAIIDLKSFGPSSRIWASARDIERLKAFLGPDFRSSVTFLGSGDFHHLSIPLIQQFEIPLSVIVFDHHPDWFSLPPRFGCGSWVKEALKKDNLKKIVILGPSSGDLDTLALFTASLASLGDNRLEIYPYRHKISKAILKRVPENIAIDKERHLFFEEITWKELAGKDLGSFILSVIKRLPAGQVYVSIDKDCLKKEYSLTNWEEGNFSLDELLLMLKIIRENLDIVGLDITGDYSPVEVRGNARSCINSLDHPQDYTAKNKPQELITRINEETNLKILQLLLSS